MSERVERILEHTGVKRFSYDHSKHEFTLGERVLSVEEAVQNPRLLGVSSEDKNTITEPALTFALGNPLGTPRMYDWINDNFTQDVSRETVDVMKDVYSAVRPDIPKDILPSDGYMGFSAEQPKRGRGHIVLTVIGNCACMSVSATGSITNVRDWPSKYASYSTHNVDSPEQKVAIYAGLAHIAFRVEQ